MNVARRRKHAREEQNADPTEYFRKHAVWLFPGVMLIHSLLIYGVCRSCARASLIAALASVFAGLAMRWVRSATTLIALAVFMLSFLLLYVLGILGPIALLVLSDRREWVPGTVLLIASALLLLLSWRIRVSFRDEWSAPLEVTPGVVLDREQQTVIRYPTDNSTSFATLAALLALGVLFVLMFALDEGSRVVTFGVGPLAAAVVTTDIIARGVTYFWVVRRWEVKHGVRLKVPPLRKR